MGSSARDDVGVSMTTGCVPLVATERADPGSTAVHVYYRVDEQSGRFGLSW